MEVDLLQLPDNTAIFSETGKPIEFYDSRECNHTQLTLDLRAEGLVVSVSSELPLCYMRLRWKHSFADSALFCGDAWERTYGDTQWRTADPARMMPWYFFASNDNKIEAFGIKVRPNAMATWCCDAVGITLWLDLRSGSRPVRLNGRTLEVATVVSAAFDQRTAFDAARQFCGMMCDDPLLPTIPAYGSNNWYYAYGNITHDSVLADAEYLASLTEGLTPRPFMVIDDGWQIDRRRDYNGGPWDRGNASFPDMKQLADKIRERNVRPGIWYRPLFFDQEICRETIPTDWRMSHDRNVIDPSIPEVLEFVKEDIRRIVGWGYELIKHDFTTVDLFGRYGFAMRFFPSADNVVFRDGTRTSAEIVQDLYRAILEAAGDALILGCNTIGHLGAGLMHLSRTGDDTSGVKWERTRKMGINTLAFRLCQNGTFFSGDADCIGVTGKIPWHYNRQWSELIAKSGTAYFCSIRPGVLTAEEEAEVRHHLQIASLQKETLEPLDWFDTTVPARWQNGSSELKYDWYEPQGDLPDFIHA